MKTFGGALAPPAATPLIQTLIKIKNSFSVLAWHALYQHEVGALQAAAYSIPTVCN